jgi:protein-S-isoprenylcysteine O-methyltransferase Ste14
MVAGLFPLLIGRHMALQTRLLPFAASVLALGALMLIWCVRDFYVSGRGTLAPWDPPRRLVIVGLYRFVRNPMYLAVLTILSGWALLYWSLALAIYAAVVAIAVHLRVVLHEERWLAKTFGDEWRAYSAHVPRWLPNLHPPR